MQNMRQVTQSAKRLTTGADPENFGGGGCSFELGC